MKIVGGVRDGSVGYVPACLLRGLETGVSTVAVPSCGADFDVAELIGQ